MKNKLIAKLKYSAVGCALTIASSSVFAASYIVPNPPAISAKAYVVMDYNSGKIIAEENADQRRAPASLTKMMTSYIIGQELKNGTIKNSDKVTIGRDAWSVNFPDSSKMFLKINTQVTVAELNRGIIVDSGNDACVAMADYIAGGSDAFAQMMNNWAQRLGLTGSHFVNPDGLDNPKHYVTARDMAILARHLIKDLPNEYKIYSEKSFTYNGITQYNRNTLLWDKSLHVDGIKTGHTSHAGYNLVTSATDKGMRLITVVMGTPSKYAREAESKKLLVWGFRFYNTVQPYKAGDSFVKARIWKGKVNHVELGVDKNVAITIPRGQAKNLKASYDLNKTLEAPLKKGAVVGTLHFTLDGKNVGNYQLVALQNVDKGGIFKQLMDYIRQLFARWF
ncbi:serine hydrolase [Celerinatantimonas diazotrophica]|uniref:serine-type D-Ala-D-Ala carboxypeptidase n=1 Tax=Celerinatantimonas diazotrophica TaxID=412034 RepID=A0A4R1K6H1_9GAMM|nr:serine hydrolase [Celerinatantimonas diazotrophica]TCK58649.1 penicillin-binding protein 6 [Celerinatantimonas diazotrophica]CAG9297278.1 D-alanyl-D-alanine carboxypeptidase DacA [Celerinatantimonas diazotrophica]